VKPHIELHWSCLGPLRSFTPLTNPPITFSPPVLDLSYFYSPPPLLFFFLFLKVSFQAEPPLSSFSPLSLCVFFSPCPRIPLSPLGGDGFFLTSYLPRLSFPSLRNFFFPVFFEAFGFSPTRTCANQRFSFSTKSPGNPLGSPFFAPQLFSEGFNGRLFSFPFSWAFLALSTTKGSPPSICQVILQWTPSEGLSGPLLSFLPFRVAGKSISHCCGSMKTSPF